MLLKSRSNRIQHDGDLEDDMAVKELWDKYRIYLAHCRDGSEVRWLKSQWYCQGESYYFSLDERQGQHNLKADRQELYSLFRSDDRKISYHVKLRHVSS